MRQRLGTLAIAALLAVSPPLAASVFGQGSNADPAGDHPKDQSVQLGPRPFYLVGKLAPGPLKSALQACGDDPFKRTDFSIGHRGGGTLQFPEHTKESHEAGARMGAGILECDVTFTSDGKLVCRHDQCDLHTTTNILVTDLAQKCTLPFSPAAVRSGDRRADQGGLGPVLHQRPHARRVQVPQGQDGRLRSLTRRRPRSSRAAPRTGGRISTRPAARS